VATPLHDELTSNQMLPDGLTRLLERLQSRFGGEVDVLRHPTIVTGRETVEAR